MLHARPASAIPVAGGDEIIAAIGRDLRAARQKRGEDLYDVADLLRIKPSFLFALEEGDYQAMPGTPYALGFLRTYADHLGMDGQRLVRRIKASEAEIVGRADLVYPTPPADQRRPSVVMGLAVLLLVGVGYGGWSWLNRDGAPDVDPVRPAPVAQAPLRSAAPSSRPVEGGTLPLLDAAAVNGAVPPPAPGTAPVLAPPVAAPAVPVVPTVVAAATPPAAVEPLPVVEGAERPASEVGQAQASEARVVLVAVENSWIQVRSSDGQFTRTRLMEAGERFALPDRADLALWTGNAGGLQILFDGAPLDALGNRGAVLKNVSLSPAALAGRRASH